MTLLNHDDFLEIEDSLIDYDDVDLELRMLGLRVRYVPETPAPLLALTSEQFHDDEIPF